MKKVFDLVKPPHNKVSRKVTAKDIDRVIEDAQKMFKLCVDGCLAIAHSQIDDKDPLRFFVTESLIVINPVITRQTNSTVDSVEGCKTFPTKDAITVQRNWKIEFEFQVIEEHKLSDVKSAKEKARDAFVIQHEVDHMDAKYIYNY